MYWYQLLLLNVIKEKILGNMLFILFRYDFLSIFDGKYENGELKEIAKLTGVFPPNVTSSGPNISIQFISDDSQVRPGFKIKFEASMSKVLGGIKLRFHDLKLTTINLDV